MDARPEVVVISGWSTFAAQAAITWCGIKDVPYLLVVESHDEGPRAGWRRTVKGTVVPPIVERAAGLLVTGTLARDSMIARGAHPERVRVFANTDRRRGLRRAGRSARGPQAGRASHARGGARGCRRALRRAPRAREGTRRARACRRCCGRPAPCARRRRRRARARSSRRARRRAVRSTHARRATSTGSGSSSCTSRRTCSRSSRSGSPGPSW